MKEMKSLRNLALVHPFIPYYNGKDKEYKRYDMRVIAGSARRLQLKTIDGLDTRPTTDRLKETLFNMIQNDLYDCNFLDLFAGSGGIGIEALSRGAKLAVFAEHNPQAVACIKENLAFTKLGDRAFVMACDYLSALRRMEDGDYRFDFVFMDPPYNHEYERRVLEYLSGSHLIDKNTTVIMEASLETDFGYLEEIGFYAWKIKKYKTNQHIFVRKADLNNS